MPESSFVLAAAQTASIAGDVNRNAETHERVTGLAAGYGVQLLVFPELSLTGYELDLARENVVDPGSPVLQALRDLAERAGMTIVAGAPVDGENGQLHIAALALCPDGSVATYTKEHVHASEKHVFTSGPGGPLLTIASVSVALAICADAAQPSHAAKALSRGAGVYAASVMITADAYERKAGLLQQYARDHAMTVLMSNYSGVSGGEMSAGRSAIWSAGGELLASAPDTGEALVIADGHGGRCVPIGTG